MLIAENEPQRSELVRDEEHGGFGLDALWNDDFHHIANVVMTGHNEAYCSDYCGTPQEFISAIKYGYLYQGQWYRWQQQPRGSPTMGLRPSAFVNYLENHDQIANSARGLRCHAMSEACIGTISEIFDAKPPYTPRGCVAQAWSVAEVLRARVKTAPLDPAVTIDKAELSMPS